MVGQRCGGQPGSSSVANSLTGKLRVSGAKCGQHKIQAIAPQIADIREEKKAIRKAAKKRTVPAMVACSKCQYIGGGGMRAGSMPSMVWR
jgi:hypothetical protein